MPAERKWLPALLLAATFLTTLVAGFLFTDPEDLMARHPELRERPLSLGYLVSNPGVLLHGLPYSLSVLAILGAHEMGHFLACRAYGVRASWPHFLPAPFLFGTFGAFIRIRSPIPSRRALFDIAVAGPLAGYALTLPALAYGLWTARPGAPVPGAVLTNFGDSLLVRGLMWLVRGSYDESVFVGPVFLAGWLGQLATCLNLFPVGQLDGGHLMYAASGRLHRRVSRGARWTLVGFLAWLLLSPGGLAHGSVRVTWEGFQNVTPWLLWTGLLFAMGDRHPPVVAWQPLGAGRWILLGAALAILILSFVPVPIRQIFGSP